MDKPKISWRVYSQSISDYEDNNDFFAGTCRPGERMSIDFLVWNNRGGLLRVEDMDNFIISVSFNCLEDTSLLQFISGEIDNNLVTPTITGGTILTFPVPAGKIISGKANDGSMKNTDNILKFKLTIVIPDKYTIKPNDLKTMTLDIIQP